MKNTLRLLICCILYVSAVLSVSNVRDNDSGLGEGSADMIVFGQMEQILDIHKSKFFDVILYIFIKYVKFYD